MVSEGPGRTRLSVARASAGVVETFLPDLRFLPAWMAAAVGSPGMTRAFGGSVVAFSVVDMS